MTKEIQYTELHELSAWPAWGIWYKSKSLRKQVDIKGGKEILPKNGEGGKVL